MGTTKNKDKFKIKGDYKNEHDHKNVENLKNEGNLKNKDDDKSINTRKVCFKVWNIFQVVWNYSGWGNGNRDNGAISAPAGAWVWQSLAGQNEGVGKDCRMLSSGES